MKKIFLATLLILFAVTSYAGQRAITDTGEQVILNSDGTWLYADKAQKPDQKIETNKVKFSRPPDSTFLLKSTKNGSAFWLNPVKWSFRKSDDNAETEYNFQLKGKDLYGMAITEGVEIPIESLAEIAMINAKNVAPNANVVKKEYRVVNGKKVIYQEFNGTIKGIHLTWLGYYYNSPTGATQLVAYTAANAVNKYKSEILDFLNGLDGQ